MYIQVDAGNNGYAADQVQGGSITIQEMIDQLQQLVDDGTPADTKLVIVTPGRYGANFYSLRGAEEPPAPERDENEPCEKGTIGCSVYHAIEGDETRCETW